MKKVANIVLMLIICVILLLLYTIVHEGAHAFFAVLFGGQISEFDINFLNGYPHVSYSGIFQPYQKAIISIAGPIIPAVLFFIILLYVNKSNAVVKKIKFITVIGILGTLLPNIILPIMYEAGFDASNEDVIKFIINSQVNGYLTAVIFALIFLLGCIVFIKKINLKEVLSEEINFNIENKKQVIMLIVCGIFTLFLIVGGCINILTNSYEASSMIKKYDENFSIKLNKNHYYNENIYEFEVNEEEIYDFYITGNCNEKLSIKLQGNVPIQGIRKKELQLFNGEGKINSTFTGWFLNKGKYKIVVSSHDNNGKIDFHINKKEALENKFSNEKIFNGIIPQLDNGYKLAAHENLIDCKDKCIYEFSLQDTENIKFSIFLTTKDGSAVVKLSGKDYEDILINDYQIFTDGRGMNLKEGDYKIMVTSSGCNGEIYLYVKRN
ncbi:M50 family metallopeptidase [Abyssisolibacter fermentans]|uniref:M50 family metallopeptidase n=1 Tax=Abyssisolibacter fermentans TaxID=1766203 RepID=UPI000832BE79|nr:M50 family metallopeptidase [Abyssisolibacter fermentans]